ncbi:flagellar export protein FliJ [Desulfosporosinus fructosivorans]|uniref:Flagellar FliJ protein n=1 Tax=Desulfosporosinus fructosivorans TaxID=2018669 RepID=A0A4Z0RCR6_9FIRM|nr:flagellar FliJ family protein [Desulfosporosinus fructosivorans]TGE39987.1 flagellar export protein FliJ [Desulfosporosinus fructosivorans]
MARFRFRLEASLRIAEQALERAQREFAQEVKIWKGLLEANDIQQVQCNVAQEVQRDAGRHRPSELGICQLFASEQQLRLYQCNAELRNQEHIMENARHIVLEAHREVEKLERLKEKQSKAFLLAELQKEQKILDETGQVLHWRRQIVNTT